MAPDLSHLFLYRVIAFSLSGTCLVDMPCDTEHTDCSREAKLACKLKAQQLTKLMNHAVMSRRKSERKRDAGSKISLSDSFQEIMYIQFLNLNVSYQLLASFNLIYLLGVHRAQRRAVCGDSGEDRWELAVYARFGDSLLYVPVLVRVHQGSPHRVPQ